MREERVVLEHRVDIAAIGREAIQRSSLHGQCAAVGSLEASDDPQQCRLAGPAFTEDGQELSVRDIERNIFKHSCAAEALTDSGDGEKWVGHYWAAFTSFQTWLY